VLYLFSSHSDAGTFSSVISSSTAPTWGWPSSAPSWRSTGNGVRAERAGAGLDLQLYAAGGLAGDSREINDGDRHAQTARASQSPVVSLPC